MIFDEHSYSTEWIPHFPLSAADKSIAPQLRQPIRTQAILGGFGASDDSWRFETGLGAEVEITETLLLHCGFRLTFANDRVYEMFMLKPGILIGILPARGRPELFASDQETHIEDDTAFLSTTSGEVALKVQAEGISKHFILCIDSDRESCLSQISAFEQALPDTLQSSFETALSQRQVWCENLPEGNFTENTGLAIERIQGCLEPATGPFTHTWFSDDNLTSPGLNVAQMVNILPALAVYQPETATALLKTLADLPANENGAWSATYSIDNTVENELGPALPTISATLATLPKEILTQLDISALVARCQKHLSSFLQDNDSVLPQWPQPAGAFTPEVTDPDELRQYDLAAFLVYGIESLQSISGDNSLLEAERKTLETAILQDYWSPKRKRLLDRTLSGEEASRVTAGTLIPLLWKRLDKSTYSACRQCLFNSDELRAAEGIRQWQPKKDDPIPPPVHTRTQHLFVPLLKVLPGEAAALLSADWHRLFQQDNGFKDPEIAALQIRLIPFANHINPNLERYPAWVRGMEKHRKGIVTVASIILLLIPSAFSIAFAFRSDFNRNDEALEAGHAETLVTMGNLSKAEEVYSRLIEKSRVDARLNQYYLDRGDLRFKQEKYQAALEDYEQAVERDPIGNLYIARWNLAQAYARLDRKAEAIATMQGFMDEYGEELPTYRIRGAHAITLWQK